MQDITAPENLEIEIRNDGKVVWLHVDGVTVFRACRIGNLLVTDHRTPEKALKNSTSHTHEPYCGCPAGTVDKDGNI